MGADRTVPLEVARGSTAGPTEGHTMGSPLTELRCKQCNALLAKNDRDGLSIRRGELQATVTGIDVERLFDERRRPIDRNSRVSRISLSSTVG